VSAEKISNTKKLHNPQRNYNVQELRHAVSYKELPLAIGLCTAHVALREEEAEAARKGI
uniref:60S ribosomal protein L13 n=1 Tax=Loa loa TaxID=7209 RepID=A0A1I7VD85_LOALO